MKSSAKSRGSSRQRRKPDRHEMNSDEPYADRKRLTFEQAEGVEPLPSQLRPKEISQELSALLWAMVYDSIVKTSDRRSLGINWSQLLFDYHVSREHRPADEYTNDGIPAIQKLKGIMLSRNYVQVFGFLQFVIRHRECPLGFQERLNFTLTEGRAAYRILDKDTIVPIGSEVELQTLERAFVDLSESEFQGARAHLREAGAALTAADYSASIRESIHAVESVARTLWPANKLSDALDKLERITTIHGALKKVSFQSTATRAMRKALGTRYLMSRRPRLTRRTPS
jgi:AbiJ N-terminal domain 4